MTRIAIIGGGPAGFFGAISAAGFKTSDEITIFEATHQPLGKVRISGGGRCNVTHHCYDPAELIKNYPRGSKELRGPFSRFQPRDTVAWFEKHGVKLKTEPDGRIFPVTDNSETIVNCLLTEAKRVGVRLHLGARVTEISRLKDDPAFSRFRLRYQDATVEEFDKVLLATGSAPRGHQFAKALGHSIIPCVPSLFTFNINDPRIRNLAGVSFENVRLSMTTAKKGKLIQTGPLLITHWGLSGPAVLKLSAWGARALHDNDYQAELTVNFLPHLDEPLLLQKLVAYKTAQGKKRLLPSFPLPLPKRYWSRIVEFLEMDDKLTWGNISKSGLKQLTVEITSARFRIDGKGIFKDEFVTCGGVNLKEIDFKTMQSKICPGLYFAGEILDIDGITGGFNFQSAWTTGWLAGLGMIQK